MTLAPGQVLHGHYLLGRVLGAGGFGITYLALNQQNGQKVAIKEYLPTVFAVRAQNSQTVTPSSRENAEAFRHGLEVFNRESQVLRHFAGNPSVVQVFDAFEANGTAYFAMEYLDGVNASALAASMGGRLSPALALEILLSIAATLSMVHTQGLLHRDVSPENIFITKDGTTKLIDFGATRFFVGERSQSLSVILKPGFAPPEQYASKGNQGPWTDLYALCATYYTAISGTRPPDAPDRLAGARLIPPAQTAPGVSKKTEAAVMKGLALDYRQRPQTIDAFLALLDGVPAAAPATHVKAEGTPFVQKYFSGTPGDKWILPKNMPMTIGRSAEKCNIVLDDANVSRVHCTICFDDKQNCFFVTDLSSNGTLAAVGRLAKNVPHPLAPGDVFYIMTKDFAMKLGVE